MFGHAKASHACIARRWAQDRCQHTHRRRLSGPVGTQEGKDLARRHGECHTVHGGKVVKPFGQTIQFYHRRREVGSSGSASPQDSPLTRRTCLQPHRADHTGHGLPRKGTRPTHQFVPTIIPSLGAPDNTDCSRACCPTGRERKYASDRYNVAAILSEGSMPVKQETAGQTPARQLINLFSVPLTLTATAPLPADC